VASGKELRRLVPSDKKDPRIISPPGGVGLVAFSENGQLLAGYCWLDHTVHVCDLATGKELHKFEDGDVRAIAFSSDGGILIRSDETRIILSDVATAKTVGEFPLNRIGYGFAFAPDGKTLAVQTDGISAIRLLDLDTGEERFSPIGHTSAVDELAFAP